MKRTLALGLVAALCLPVAALGQDSKPGTGSKPATPAAAKPAAQPEKKPDAAQPPAGGEMADMAAIPLGPEHDMLKQFEGKWKAAMQMFMEGQEVKSEGTMKNSLILGGRFLRQEFKGDFMGQPFEGLGYWGYDRAKGQWISSWMDTWNTGMMTSEKGSYDAATKTWTIDSKYTNPENGKEETHRESIKVIDTDTHIMDMFMVDDGGKATKMMSITYTRAGKGEAKGHEKQDDHGHGHDHAKDSKDKPAKK